MSATLSEATGRPYGIQRVCQAVHERLARLASRRGSRRSRSGCSWPWDGTSWDERVGQRAAPYVAMLALILVCVVFRGGHSPFVVRWARSDPIRDGYPWQAWSWCVSAPWPS